MLSNILRILKNTCFLLCYIVNVGAVSWSLLYGQSLFMDLVSMHILIWRRFLQIPFICSIFCKVDKWIAISNRRASFSWFLSDSQLSNSKCLCSLWRHLDFIRFMNVTSILIFIVKPYFPVIGKRAAGWILNLFSLMVLGESSSNISDQ